jgi:hypothetical protein
MTKRRTILSKTKNTTKHVVVEEYRRLVAQLTDPDDEVRMVAAKTILDKAGFVAYSLADLHGMTPDELQATLARVNAEIAARERQDSNV